MIQDLVVTRVANALEECVPGPSGGATQALCGIGASSATVVARQAGNRVGVIVSILAGAAERS